MQSELICSDVALLVCRSLSGKPLGEKGNEKAYGGKTYTEVGRRRKHVIRVPPLPFISPPPLVKYTPKRPVERGACYVLLQAPEASKRPPTRPRRLSVLAKISPAKVFLRKSKYDYKQNALRRSEEISRALSSEDLRLFGLSAKTVG